MRIAVIIVGNAEFNNTDYADRDIMGSGRNHFNNNELQEIKRCYDLDHPNTDIFIYNNATEETNNKIKDFFGDKIKYLNTIKGSPHELACKHIIANNNQTIFDNNAKFYKLCVEEGILDNRALSIHVPFNNKCFFQHGLGKPSFWQVYQVRLALEAIKAYEIQQGFKYDYIMKIRPDFYLKHDRFGPNHYFNDMNDILLKSYRNLKYFYDQISDDDQYHPTEFRVNNYLYWRTTKYLGGMYIINKDSYQRISPYLSDRTNFNNKISEEYMITINDACYFSNGDNFKLVIGNLFDHYGEYYYNKDVKFWWTAEAQLQSAILQSGLYYFDYMQNNNYYRGRESWTNDYHGTERYDKKLMKTCTHPGADYNK